MEICCGSGIPAAISGAVSVRVRENGNRSQQFRELGSQIRRLLCVKCKEPLRNVRNTPGISLIGVWQVSQGGNDLVAR